MEGYLNVSVGPEGLAFDPRAELRDLRDRVAAEQRHHGYMSAIRLLLDLAMDGYLPDRDGGLLMRTSIENILVFEDSGVRLGFAVPGNGRHSTPHISFLGAQFCALDREQRAADRESFARAMHHRSRSGTDQSWPLARYRR